LGTSPGESIARDDRNANKSHLTWT
jgi:hypothetical protein